MVVLRAIGKFFARIGRWIKETAWVQPLLIVGGIFAIIFSIPYIVKGVSSWFDQKGTASENFYSKFQVSLNGATKQDSDADKLINYLSARAEGTATEEQINKYGDQFFLSIVKEGCSGCEETYPGFETLQNNWNTGNFAVSEKASKDFKLYTINVSETVDDELRNDETAFDVFWNNHPDFFEEAVTVTEGSYYYVYKGGSGSDYASLLEKINDLENFQTPTTFMIDFKAESSKEYGICDIIFNFDGKNSGSSSYALAGTLIDCWNHAGVFAGEKE